MAGHGVRTPRATRGHITQPNSRATPHEHRPELRCEALAQNRYNVTCHLRRARHAFYFTNTETSSPVVRCSALLALGTSKNHDLIVIDHPSRGSPSELAIEPICSNHRVGICAKPDLPMTLGKEPILH